MAGQGAQYPKLNMVGSHAQSLSFVVTFSSKDDIEALSRSIPAGNLADELTLTEGVSTFMENFVSGFYSRRGTIHSYNEFAFVD
jgi:hypothetical protein